MTPDPHPADEKAVAELVSEHFDEIGLSAFRPQAHRLATAIAARIRAEAEREVQDARALLGEARQVMVDSYRAIACCERAMGYFGSYMEHDHRCTRANMVAKIDAALAAKAGT